jgi:transposase
MDERMRFITKVIEGHSMTDVCRQFGISRKTGHKIWNRYKDSGSEALTDRSRRPVHYAHQLPFQVEQAILALKNEFKTWTAPRWLESFRHNCMNG